MEPAEPRLSRMMEAPMADSDAQQPAQARWCCWECLRRRLVCDSTRPICNKCRASGIVCPGYDNKKPLIWLAPGKVTSRTRQRKGSPAGKGKARPLTDETKAKAPAAPASTEIIPRLELRTDTCDIVDGMLYYNLHIYPHRVANQLAQSPLLIPLPPIQRFSTSIRHDLVSMAICHRIFHQPGANRQTTQTMWSKLHYHRGVAIRALNEDIGKETTRSSDTTIRNVQLLMFAELQQSISTDWRNHLNGIDTLITLRGGMEELARSAPHMKITLLCRTIVLVMGNTTTAADQIAVSSDVQMVDLISELYQMGLYPGFPCPLPLFLDVVRINHFRSQGASSPLPDDLAQSAAALLRRVNDFPGKQWAESHESFQDEWQLVADIYQSAVLLYCISSLQSLSILPSTQQLKSMRKNHGERLFTLLQKAQLCPQVREGTIWPLVVAGVEAADGSAVVRAFVGKELLEMGRDQGTSLPLVAKGTLERFWASGRTGWDECFDKPYAFVS